jgi:xanthine dehydrogenase FAD-binding subunit
VNYRDLNIQYCFPETIEAAYQLKAKMGEGARYIAGGTDLILLMERENLYPECLIDLTRIPELQRLEIVDGQITIGAGITYSRLLDFPPIETQVRILASAIRTIGGVQIRNIATLAGNLVNASPAGDSLPPLYCLEAEVNLASSKGSRTLPIQEFILGVRKTALLPNEIVTSVSFPVPNHGWYGRFEKLGLRRAMAIAVASAAILLEIENQKVVQARIALGAVAPTVVSVLGGDNPLVTGSLNEKSIEEVAQLASESCFPIDDLRASARYRKEVVHGLVRRGLNSIQEEISAQE